MFTIILYGFGMICMELTRTEAVFSRTTMVFFLCRNESSPNELKLFDDFFGTKEALEDSWEGQNSHEGAQPNMAHLEPNPCAGVSCSPRGPSSRETDAKKSYKYRNPQK